MATHRIPILGFNTMPDASGNVFYEPYNIKATNDIWRHGHFIFNDSGTRILLYGAFDVPQNYVGSAAFITVWTTTATSGDVVLDVDYRAVGGNDAESLDQATAQESLTVTDTAPSAVNERMEVTVGSATASNFAVGDTVEFIFGRDGAQGADTMAAALQLVGLYFQYADA